MLFSILIFSCYWFILYLYDERITVILVIK